MFRRDYILRQIDELGKTLEKALSLFTELVESGKPTEALVQAELDLNGALDWDIESLLNIPDEQFVSRLISEKQFSYDSFLALANLLYMMAEHQHAQQLKCYQKSLEIYLYLETHETNFSFERHWRIDEIRKKIQSFFI